MIHLKRRIRLVYQRNQSISSHHDCIELNQCLINFLESKLSQKSLPELKTTVSAILDGIPSRKVPDWDLR